MADRTDIHVQRDETIVVRSDVDPRGADTEAIRAEIRETRERMSHTLDGISERLHPDVLKDQVKHKVREATIGRAEDMARHAAGRVTETRHSIMDTLRDNPIPAAMVGIGLGWLVWNGRKEDAYRTAHVEYDVRYGGYGGGYAGSRGAYEEPGMMDRAGGRASEMGSQVRDRASEMGDRVSGSASDLADSARERAHDLGSRASETMSDFADRTREAAGDARDRARSAARSLANETRYRTHRVEDRYQENPLALGAAAVALGFMAGLSAPTTRREVELMGDARDELVGKVRDMASETADKAQRVAGRVAEEVGSTAKETAQQAAKQEGLTPSSQGGSSGGSSGGSGQQGASGQGGTAGGGSSFGSVPGGTALGDTHTRPGGV